MPSDPPIKLGVSACLLGEPVRYDGGHKRDPFITDLLGRFFSLVPVCPEVEVGMGVPREAVHLEDRQGQVRLIRIRSREDWTERMQAYADQRLDGLARENLAGFIFKAKSPSSGMERVPIYNEKGTAAARGSGMFAGAFMSRFPMTPVEDEGRLHDAGLRENFIERVFAYHRLQQMLRNRFSRRAVIEFHTAHKLLLMAHSPRHYQWLGKRVATMDQVKPSEFLRDYALLFMEAMALKATTKKHTNVLMHLFGYLKRHLDAEEKIYILKIIEDYRQGLLPLVAPLILLKHYIQKYKITYLSGQIYLDPHPKELMLRNHS